jgi:hypothetical protein
MQQPLLPLERLQVAVGRPGQPALSLEGLRSDGKPAGVPRCMCHCVRMYGVYVWMDLVDGKSACVSRGICCGCAAGANTAEVETYILAVLLQMSPVTNMRPRHSLVSPRQLLVQAQLVRGGQLLLNGRLGASWGRIHLQVQ